MAQRVSPGCTVYSAVWFDAFVEVTGWLMLRSGRWSGASTIRTAGELTGAAAAAGARATRLATTTATTAPSTARRTSGMVTRSIAARKPFAHVAPRVASSTHDVTSSRTREPTSQSQRTHAAVVKAYAIHSSGT